MTEYQFVIVCFDFKNCQVHIAPLWHSDLENTQSATNRKKCFCYATNGVRRCYVVCQGQQILSAVVK